MSAEDVSGKSSGPVVPATFVCWCLLAANVGMFLAEMALGGAESRRALLTLGAKVGPLIDQGQYWRLLTAAFLHAGLTHLGFNMAALMTFGRLGEIIYGHIRFLAIYLESAIGSTTASYAFLPDLSVGASGALFGIAGGLVVFYAVNRKLAGPTGRSQLMGYLVLLGANVAFGVAQPGIDNYGHLGGLAMGALLGFCLAPRLVGQTVMRPVPIPDARGAVEMVPMLEVHPENPPTIAWLSVPAGSAALWVIVSMVRAGHV
jgi:rhomboid protease GluP